MEEPGFEAPDWESRIDIAIEHLQLLGEEKGDRGAIEFRKHLACYLKTMPNNKYVRGRMAEIDSVEKGTEVLEAFRRTLKERRERELSPAVEQHDTAFIENSIQEETSIG